MWLLLPISRPSQVLGVGQAPLKLSGDWTLAQCCHMCFFSVLKASIRHHMWYQGLLLMQHPSWELLEPQPEVPLGFISIFFFSWRNIKYAGAWAQLSLGCLAPDSGCVLWELADQSANDITVSIRQIYSLVESM